MVKQNLSVNVGDRFQKVGDLYGGIWIVTRLWTATDGLPHARLEAERNSDETRIVSLSALGDPHFYKPALGMAAQ